MNSAREVLQAWDNNEIIHTIEMGGLGPGYEQAIHAAVFETIRELLGVDLKSIPDEELSDFMNKAMWGSAEISKLGLSGAQAGAAKHVAYKALTIGWEELQKIIPDDRRIMVRKHFPPPLTNNGG